MLDMFLWSDGVFTCHIMGTLGMMNNRRHKQRQVHETMPRCIFVAIVTPQASRWLASWLLFPFVIVSDQVCSVPFGHELVVCCSGTILYIH